MQRINKLSVLALVGVLGALNVPSVTAQEALEPEGGQTLDAAEGVNLRLQVNGQREVVAVRIVECEGCQPTTYLPDRQLAIELGGKAVDVERALSANGGAGVVLYHPGTRMAEIVVFYGQ